MSENRRPLVNTTQRPAQRPTGQRPAGQRPPQSSRPQGARPSQSTRKPVRRKKKKNNGGAIALLLLIAVLVLAICLIVPRLGKNSNDPTPVVAATQQPDIAPAQNLGTETTQQTQQTPPTYNITTLDASKLSPNEKLDSTWRSILLLGTDARLWDDMKHTDTMIIVCYNTQNGSIRMISVMRDAFVDIPEKSSAVRINTVSSYAKMEGLIRTLNECLGLNIREYALVDFAGFRSVVDILGGINVDITEVEMQYINSGLVEQVNLLVEKRDRERMLAECTLSAYGPQTHLNGLQSLAYARIRKSDSDFKRTERQRTVVMEAANKAINTMSIVQMSQIASSMLQYVETNIPLTSVIQLGAQVLQNGIGDVQDMRVPINDTYKGESRGKTTQVWGMYDVDWGANKAAVSSLLNGY